jgi:hypothetical protein
MTAVLMNAIDRSGALLSAGVSHTYSQRRDYDRAVAGFDFLGKCRVYGMKCSRRGPTCIISAKGAVAAYAVQQTMPMYAGEIAAIYARFFRMCRNAVAYVALLKVLEAATGADVNAEG